MLKHLSIFVKVFYVGTGGVIKVCSMTKLELKFGRGQWGVNCKGPFAPSISINDAMTLAILFSLKTIESLQNGFATHFQATPLSSMRTE